MRLFFLEEGGDDAEKQSGGLAKQLEGNHGGRKIRDKEETNLIMF